MRRPAQPPHVGGAPPMARWQRRCRQSTWHPGADAASLEANVGVVRDAVFLRNDGWCGDHPRGLCDDVGPMQAVSQLYCAGAGDASRIRV